MGAPAKPPNNGLGECIEQQWKAHCPNLSRKELAFKLRISERTLSSWIRSVPNELNMFQGNIIPLCKFLNRDRYYALRAYRSPASDYKDAMSVSSQSLSNAFSDDGKKIKLVDEELLVFYGEDELYNCQFGNVEYVIPVVRIYEPTFGTDNDSVSFTLENSQFVIDPEISKVTEEFEKKAKDNPYNHNGATVRLASFKKSKSGFRGRLQPATYFDAIRTNFIPDARIPELGNKSLREYYHGNGRRLPPLHADKFANHIGVVAMVESSDGYLIIQKRSNKVIGRTKTLSASASGVLDLTRIMGTLRFRKKLTLGDMFYDGMKVEINDELGINENSAYCLGIFRELQRGGKPEIYFYVKSALDRHGILRSHKIADEVWETDDLIFQPLNSGFMISQEGVLSESIIDAWVNDNYQKYSEISANLTLKLGILLIGEYVRSRYKSIAH